METNTIELLIGLFGSALLFTFVMVYVNLTTPKN